MLFKQPARLSKLSSKFITSKIDNQTMAPTHFLQTLPKTMRAVIHTQSTQSLRLEPHWPVPVPTEKEYLIKVSAAAITTGELWWPRPPELNESTPGVELAGAIVSTPSSPDFGMFQLGDEVYMRVPFPRPGGMREYTTALEKDLARVPKNLTPVDVASIPLSALTSWQGLFQYAGLEAAFDAQLSGRKEKILVIGASSGCGVFFIQLAKLAGHHETGVCSTRNVQVVQGLGADEVVDYTSTSVADCGKFDIVFDCVGGQSLDDGWQCLATGGKLFTIVPPATWNIGDRWDLDPPAHADAKCTGLLFVMNSDGEQLTHITKLFDEGKLKTKVDGVWKLEEYEAAFERLATRRVVGKVVIDVSSG